MKVIFGLVEDRTGGGEQVAWKMKNRTGEVEGGGQNSWHGRQQKRRHGMWWRCIAENMKHQVYANASEYCRFVRNFPAGNTMLSGV